MLPENRLPPGSGYPFNATHHLRSVHRSHSLPNRVPAPDSTPGALLVMPIITTPHSLPMLSDPIMTYPHQDTRFDRKSLIPRGFCNSIEPVVRTVGTVQSDDLHHQNLGYGRTLSDQDLSFFDFEPQVTTYQVQSTFSDMNGPHSNVTWSDTDGQLLSPPNSAVFSPKPWPNCEPMRPSPPNVLTDVKPANSRTNYGQFTPTDDDHSEKFILTEPLPPRSTSPPPTPNKKRKRASAVISKSQSPLASKRLRRDGNRLELHSTPQMDPSNQDANRRSRFLERNRLAASKCRQKKKQWVENLEVKARNFQAQFKHLNLVVDSLKEELLYLKVEMVRHKGCEGSEIQKCIEIDDDAFAEAMERLEQLEREKPASGEGSSSPHSDPGTGPVQPMKDLEPKKRSDRRRSTSALPLDDMNLAEALLREDYFPTCCD